MIGNKEQTFYTVKDVAASDFIQAYAHYLRSSNKIKIPEKFNWVKTGVRQELAPQDPDWVYVRVAAVARKIFLRQNLGVGALRHIFGGRQRFGNLPEAHSAAGGSVIRWALQELERINVLKKDKKNTTSKKNSRIVTKEGQTDLNRIANEVAKKSRQQ